MNKSGNKKGLLIGIVAIICVSLLIVGILFPFLVKDDGSEKSTGTTGTGTPLTTYDDTVIEPGSNKINGLTNEGWFSEAVEGETLNFDTENLGASEFTSSESDQRYTFGGEDDLDAGNADKAKDAEEAAPTSGDDVLPREIEEADIIKLEGDTLYVLNTYRGLMIIDVSDPDDPEIISRVPMFGYPVEMYIVEPRAYIVLSHYYNAFLWAEDGAEPEYRHGSEIVIVDISKLTNPVVEKYIELNAFISDTRRVGEVIYAVANNFDYYGWGFPEVGNMGVGTDAVEVGVRAEVVVEEETEEKVEEPVSTPESGSSEDSESSSSDSSDPVEPKEAEKEKADEVVWVDDDEIYFEEPKDATVVISINMEDLSNIVEVDRESFSGSSNQIHVTEEAIFVAQQEYEYYSDPIFGFNEKYYTKVTYVDISDYHGEIKVRDSFKVDGNLEDRYQMDYYDETFRIVTHFWGRGDKLGESKLWIVDTSNPDDITHKGDLLIDDAGSLMATRFAGERAYTIHLPYSIDPLDVLDLSDPSDPVLTDILEMPGWVTHMEVRGFKILALGVDDSEGKQKVAVSLFDVSDPYNAILEERVTIGDGYSWSSANWDPKALSVIDDQNLILVPFESYSYDENGKYRSFSGLQIVEFDLEEGDLTAGGSIEQMGAVQRTRANSERIFAISYKQLQVIDAGNLNKPKITATLELCNNIIDIIPMDDYCIQVISEYDYTKSMSVTKLRTVDSENPDTSQFLAEKSVDYGIIKFYLNDDLIYLIGNKYLEEEHKTEGHILVYDYSEPTKPKLKSDFMMEYYSGNNNWWYYDYYGGYYSPRSSVTEYSFILVDSDLLVYHPDPEWNYYYWEDDVVYDEVEPGDSNKTEKDEPVNDNKTDPPEEKKKEESEPPQKNDWNTVTENLYFIDLTNPDKPVDVGNLTLINTSRITGMHAIGNTLYLIQYLDQSHYDDNHRWQYEVKYYLTEVDLAKPAEPKLADPINIPGGFLGISDSGNVIYTRTSEYDDSYNWHQTLNVLELKDGKAVLASALDLGDNYPDIIVQDSMIIVTYSDYSYYYYDYLEYGAPGIKSIKDSKPTIMTKIQIIDASEPKNLKLKSTIGLKNFGSVHKLEQDKLYIQLSDANGLLIYDISDTSSPDFLGYYPTHGWIASIREDQKTGKIYIACGEYGVLMIEIAS